ncbi:MULTISPECIES: hypothetical protein [Methylobacteriaceae]|uniref:Uncharacterized protein n=2 Tax=Methylobacteriaceae TaxID=119045 RepID=A0AA37MCG6_9HYPH|nr:MULTISPECIES: hypothetical protein [Methylobacteriaceae]MDQ0520118.1 hypothetical protein [Methylobacterium gregans]BAU90593.1 hypothetical protein MPPM_1988 [Methylorubrum populi]GJD81270.1 hypothetical protein NBEOAGPD_4516 [Methylobacterium gregans]GLS52522.1 hypothetical protein GCM10007886_07050 [Methylobacterium gregans]
MTSQHPKRARLPVLDAALSQVRGRDEDGLVRPELADCAVAIRQLGPRAYALGLFAPSGARLLGQTVVRLAEALPANPDDRRAPREERS